MNTPKHTTGPWSVEDWNYSEPGREHVPVIRTCADAIAEALPLWNASVDREPERLANARLIAAAPELLDALRMVIAHDGALTGADWTAIRDAVDKAEGGSDEPRNLMAGLVKYADWIIGGTMLAGWLVIVVVMVRS